MMIAWAMTVGTIYMVAAHVLLIYAMIVGWV